MNWFRYLLFGCGQLGMMLLARFFFQWIILFAGGEHQGISAPLFAAAAVGSCLLLFRIFDGVTDPLAGFLSDYWIRRGHQRRTLLIFSFLLPGIGLILCFSPTTDLSSALRWFLLISGMFVFFVGYTLYAIPYWSLIEDYSQGNTQTRRVLSNILGAGLMLATACGFMITPFSVQHWDYLPSAIFFSGLASVLMILPYFAQPPGMISSRAERQIAPSQPMIQSFFKTLKHRRFLATLFLLAGSQMSLTIMTSASPFIAIHLLGGEKQDVAYLMGPLLAGAIPCFAIIPWIAARFGWERSLLAASLLLGLAYCLAGFLGITLFHSPFTTAMVLFAIAGPMIAVLLGLEGEAITACAQETGEEAVGRYFGVFNLVVKSLNGVAIFSAGVFVELSQGSMGIMAIRLMTASSGLSLFLGVALYFLIREKNQSN